MKFPRVRIKSVFWLTLALLLGFGIQPALAKPQAMHIMEGFLPPVWCVVWFAVAIPFWVVGYIKIQKLVKDKPESRLLLGMVGAFAFVLSNRN
jgi:cobalt/nickel transport system permease protein